MTPPDQRDYFSEQLYVVPKMCSATNKFSAPEPGHALLWDEKWRECRHFDNDIIFLGRAVSYKIAFARRKLGKSTSLFSALRT
jgi:hypothetical protein